MTIRYDDRWNWTATTSLALAIISPIVVWLGMWGVIGIGHGSSRGAHALYWSGLALCVLSAVLGVVGLRSPRWRGRKLGIPGMGVGFLALLVITWVVLDDQARRQYLPFLR